MKQTADVRVKLSFTWIVLMMNMIFADIFSIMVELVNGGGAEIPGEVKTVMAIAAVVTNIPIMMILLSRLLNYRLNRIFNIVAGMLTIVYIIGGGDLSPHYIIIAAIETVLAVFIIITAWRWKE